MLERIREQSGKHFDPNVVKLFLENYAQIVASAKATQSDFSASR
ncbi:hypothetical protein [Psychromonas sp.]